MAASIKLYRDFNKFVDKMEKMGIENVEESPELLKEFNEKFRPKANDIFSNQCNESGMWTDIYWIEWEILYRKKKKHRRSNNPILWGLSLKALEERLKYNKKLYTQMYG